MNDVKDNDTAAMSGVDSSALFDDCFGKPEKLRHKETFFQQSEPEVGLPSTWVVQYWAGDEPFCHASYFSSYEDAKEFEEEILSSNTKDSHAK